MSRVSVRRRPPSAAILVLAAVAGLGAGCAQQDRREAKPTSSEAEAAAAPPPAKYTEVETPGAARDAKAIYRSDTVDVIIAPAGSSGGGDKLEYKIRMKAGDTLTYAWMAEADDLWHEFHGHTEGTVAFYKKATGAAHQGVLVAPFEGVHGWYFENRSPKQVIVKLQMGGFYELAPD